jgi:hypothetical protein
VGWFGVHLQQCAADLAVHHAGLLLQLVFLQAAGSCKQLVLPASSFCFLQAASFLLQAAACSVQQLTAGTAVPFLHKVWPI